MHIQSVAFGLVSFISVTAAQTTVIPDTCFDDYSQLEEHFSYLYPWGSDHNGAARMSGDSENHEYISINTPGTLTLTAKRVDGEDPAGDIEIRYLSGAVHANEEITVDEGSGFDFEAEFRAPVATGTWPAFWLTAVDSWPPEIDLAEWKGSGDISFNTFNTSDEVDALDVPYENPDDFHSIRCELRGVGSSVETAFYMDGEHVTTQYGNEFVGKPFYLIINLQMEGSSGSPGPEEDTVYEIRNLTVTQV